VTAANMAADRPTMAKLPPAAAKRFDRQRPGGQIAGEGLARPMTFATSTPLES
jgi:hypothetical protein